MSKTVETTREMKNSGIEWLGKIPSEWNPLKLKLVFSERAGGAWGEDPQNNNNDVACIRIADFNYATFKISKKEDYTKRNYKVNQINKLSLKKGDLLIEKSGGGENTPVGRAVLFDLDIEALYANFMDRLRVRSGICPEFVLYLLAAMYSNAVTKKYIKQTTGIQNLGLTDLLSNEVVFIPPLHEQKVIATYLDEQVGKLDNLISEQKQAIEEWKDYKQSLITETVTKGLNPNVEMKDSGVEWIGMIPRDWGIVPNKYVMKKVKEICSKYNNEDILSLSTKGVIVRDLNNPFGKMPTTFDGYQRVSKGNLLMCLFDIDVTPRCVGLICNDGLTSPAYSQFVLKNKNVANYYYYYYLNLDFTKELLHLSKNLRNSLTESLLGEIKVPVPPLHEQQAIADYLDEKCLKIDEAIEQKQTLIKQLEEYKQSLIYECVTGKRRVL